MHSIGRIIFSGITPLQSTRFLNQDNRSLTPYEAGPDGLDFLRFHIPILLNRFTIRFNRDSTCLEYLLFNRHTPDPFSRSLILSHEVHSGSIYVSKFYPEIYKRTQCRYLSAACFYMLVHHAAGVFNLPDGCRVNLEADLSVFEAFYVRLIDFQFRICHSRPAGKVYVRGCYHAAPFSTQKIEPICLTASDQWFLPPEHDSEKKSHCSSKKVGLIYKNP